LNDVVRIAKTVLEMENYHQSLSKGGFKQNNNFSFHEITTSWKILGVVEAQSKGQ
jgi:hypothetical protein